MGRGLKIGLPVAALIIGLAVVAPAQIALWVSTASGLTTSGTIATTSTASNALDVDGGARLNRQRASVVLLNAENAGAFAARVSGRGADNVGIIDFLNTAQTVQLAAIRGDNTGLILTAGSGTIQFGSPVDAITFTALPGGASAHRIGVSGNQLVLLGGSSGIGLLNSGGGPLLSVDNTGITPTVPSSVGPTLTPATLNANQNDYSPAGFTTASFVRLSASTPVAITGMAAGFAGRLIFVSNVSANGITFNAEHSGSTAANRFTNSLVIEASESGVAIYDGISSRWRWIAGGTIG